jgi:hypothetical protein
MAQQQIVKEDRFVKDERSIGELFSELANETTTLLKQEVALLQVELTQKAAKIGKNVGFLVIGGVIANAALLAFVAALIAGLANFMQLWLAALIVGVVIAIAAAVLISSGLKNFKNMDLKPKESVESLKEDAKWLKEQI